MTRPYNAEAFTYLHYRAGPYNADSFLHLHYWAGNDVGPYNAEALFDVLFSPSAL